MRLIGLLVVSLALTLMLERLFASLWGVEKRDVPLVYMVNVITNPIVVFLDFAILPSLPIASSLTILILEVIVVCVEGQMYATRANAIHFPRLFALCANLFSYTSGLLLVSCLY